MLSVIFGKEVLEVDDQWFAFKYMGDIAIGRTLGDGIIGMVDGEERLVELRRLGKVASAGGTFRVKELGDGVDENEKNGEAADYVREHRITKEFCMYMLAVGQIGLREFKGVNVREA